VLILKPLRVEMAEREMQSACVVDPIDWARKIGSEIVESKGGATMAVSFQFQPTTSSSW